MANNSVIHYQEARCAPGLSGRTVHATQPITESRNVLTQVGGFDDLEVKSETDPWRGRPASSTA